MNATSWYALLAGLLAILLTVGVVLWDRQFWRYDR